MNIAVNVNNVISVSLHVHHSTCRPDITCTVYIHQERVQEFTGGEGGGQQF